MRLYPGQKVGRFRVERHLGSDERVESYAVVRPDQGTDHALHLIRPEVPFDPSRVPTAVVVPSLVRVDAILDLDGVPALLTELVTGPTLEQVLDEGPLTVEQVDALATDLLDGLAALHHAGHAHGALRPATVRLDLSDDAPRARLTVLGLPDPPGPDIRLDVLRYRSLHGDPPAMDVFALGCVLYELLTGRPAHDGEDRAELRAALLDPEPPDLPDAVPERMRAALQAALGPVHARPADATALREVWSPPESRPLVSWADRHLEEDDEAISLSAPVPLLRQAAPVVRSVWTREANPAPAPGAPRNTPEAPATPEDLAVHLGLVSEPTEPPPPDPTLASLDTLLPEDEVQDTGEAPSDTSHDHDRPAPPAPGDPVRDSIRTSVLAGAVGISVALAIGALAVCLFGGTTWLLSPGPPPDPVLTAPAPVPVTWPPPPQVEQDGVPEGHVRLQLVAHSEGVRISWESPATGTTSDAPRRSGALDIVPVGDLAVAWASATSRARCVVPVTPATRQLRLDGRDQHCEAR